MPTTIILLVCIFVCSNGIFLQVNSSIISFVPTAYEEVRELFSKADTVTKVRTVAELKEKGNKLATLDFIGLVQQYDGYEAEEYDVQTEDGYILKLHRISSSPLSPKAPNKPVVYMQHGVLCTSEFYVVLGPRHDLAYMLADAGYDIWLGNARGTTYSRRHIKYSPASNNYDFWKFNIDDVGLKDTPALIDAVLAKTNKTKLVYIGHSLGSTMNFVLLSSKPEYNNKIYLSISLAPVAYFAKPHTFFVDYCLALRALIPLGHALQIYELLPLSTFVVAFARSVCTNSIGKYLCGLITSPVLSFHNVNLNNISSIYTVALNGVSLDIMIHFGQLISKGKFRKFDFGTRLNREKYNSSEPPEYDLSKVTAPQALFYSDHDTFINSKAAEKVKTQLKNVVSFEKVPKSYGHLDFVWADNARSAFYYKVLKLVNKFST